MLAFGHPRLYACTQRVAFHAFSSRLLSSKLTCEEGALQASASEVAAPSALEEDTEKVVDGMQDMLVSDDAESAATSSKKRKERENKHRSGLKTCSEAISKGLTCFDSGDYPQAIELFTAALELPGNGAMRMSGSVREYLCPSEGEEQAALYNMACCYARLNEVDSGLTCLSGLLESGFDDFETLRSDSDLASLRKSSDFEALVSKYDNLASKLLGRKKRKTDKKSWLTRW